METKAKAPKTKAAKAAKAPKAAQAAAKPLTKRAKKLQRLANAAKITFTLEAEVRKLVTEQAKKDGLDMGHFMQKLVENHILATAEPGNELAARLSAKRAVIDKTVALAQDIDAKGGFDEHFILTVMKTAAKDAEYTNLYETAIGAAANAGATPAKAAAPLNQQLGRMIKKAVGAKSKKNEAGRIARGQVTGEAISTYTLLEKAS